jgi:hypothetical protein
MPSEPPIKSVVELLATHWRTRLAGLNSYLLSTFGVPAPENLPTSLHLSQMSDGSVNPQNIGHMFAAVWLVQVDSIQEVPLGFQNRTRWDKDESDAYYLMHAYSFVLEGDELLLSERYGPGLVHRSRGRVIAESPLAVEWETLWYSTQPNSILDSFKARNG